MGLGVEIGVIGTVGRIVGRLGVETGSWILFFSFWRAKRLLSREIHLFV